MDLDDVRLVDPAGSRCARRHASPRRKSWLPRIRSTGTPAATVSASAASTSGWGGAIVVVAEPQVEHVAEEVEPLRAPHRTGEKVSELGDRAPVCAPRDGCRWRTGASGESGALRRRKRATWVQDRTSSGRRGSGRAMISGGARWVASPCPAMSGQPPGKRLDGRGPRGVPSRVLCLHVSGPRSMDGELVSPPHSFGRFGNRSGPRCARRDRSDDRHLSAAEDVMRFARPPVRPAVGSANGRGRAKNCMQSG